MQTMASSDYEIWISLGLPLTIVFNFVLLVLPSTTSSSGHILLKVLIFHSMPKVLVKKSVYVNTLLFLFDIYRVFSIMIQICYNNLFFSTYSCVLYYVILNFYE